MAKNLPYFKFTVAEWLTGDIFFEPLNVQGLFINVCALYWQRNGILMIEDINKRFRNPPELELLTNKFLTVQDGFITISFLDEQLNDRQPKAKQSRINGSKGGRPKNLKITQKEPKNNLTNNLNDENSELGLLKTPFETPDNIDKKTQQVILENQTGYEHKPNIEKIREEKIRKDKNGTNDFTFDFVEENFKSPFRVWYKYRMEIKPFRVQVEVEACYSELKKMSNGNALEAFKIVQSSISNSYNSLQLPTSKQPIQTTNLQGTI